MRISDIKGDRTIDVIADLIEPIINIGQTDAGKAFFFSDDSIPAGMDKITYGAKKMCKYAPSLLHDCKSDIIVILSVLEGVGIEEYKQNLTLKKLLQGFIELLTDKDFIELFFSAQQAERIFSGAAPETTEEASA